MTDEIRTTEFGRIGMRAMARAVMMDSIHDLRAHLLTLIAATFTRRENLREQARIDTLAAGLFNPPSPLYVEVSRLDRKLVRLMEAASLCSLLPLRVVQLN